MATKTNDTKVNRASADDKHKAIIHRRYSVKGDLGSTIRLECNRAITLCLFTYWQEDILAFKKNNLQPPLVLNVC